MLLSVCRNFPFSIRKEPLFFNSLIFTNSFARISNELNIDLEGSLLILSFGRQKITASFSFTLLIIPHSQTKIAKGQAGK